MGKKFLKERSVTQVHPEKLIPPHKGHKGHKFYLPIGHPYYIFF